MRKKLGIVVVVVALSCFAMAFGLTGCSKGGGKKTADELQLNYSEYDLTLNDVFTLSVIDGGEAAEATFSSNNAGVATVTAEGVVTGKALGQAVLTVTCGDKSADCIVNVVSEARSDTLSFFASSIHVRVGGSPFALDVLFNGKPVESGVKFASDDQSIVTVDENGRVTAVAKGQTSIKASYAGLTAACNVTVKAFSSVAFTESVIYLKPENQAEIAIEAYDGVSPDPVQEPEIEWQITDPSVLEIVRSEGKYYAKALASGSATVTAVFEDSTAVCTISVARSVSTWEEFAAAANTPAAYIILETDLDMLDAGAMWSGDGRSAVEAVIPKFSGYLDGNGHKLGIVKYWGDAGKGETTRNSFDTHNSGFFGTVTDGSVIENLYIHGSVGYRPEGNHRKSIYGRHGFLAYENFGDIRNCYVTADIRVNKGSAQGTTIGLIYKNSGSVSNVITDFSFAADGRENPAKNPFAYGIAVSNRGEGKIENCVSISSASSGDIRLWISGSLTDQQLGTGLPTGAPNAPSDYLKTLNQPDPGRKNCAVFADIDALLTGAGLSDAYDENDAFDKMAYGEVAAATARGWFADSAVWKFEDAKLMFFEYEIVTQADGANIPKPAEV